MSARLRVAILGLSHDHVWEHVQQLAESEQGELVAAAEPIAELRERISNLSNLNVYTDAQTLLEREQLDAVYIYSDNRSSAELATEAARRGLHVMLEKPLAADFAGAAQAVGAAYASGTHLMVNWPIAWWPNLQHAYNLIAEGRIGEVWQVNYRGAHGGPREYGHKGPFAEWLYDPHRNGAGALIDYCSYGVALAVSLLGLPSRVTALSSRIQKLDLPSEDNAVLVMQHTRALSTATASWTQRGMATSYSPVFYGSMGTLLAYYHDGSLWLATDEQKFGERLEVPPAPQGHRNATEFFLGHIRSGEPIRGLCSAEVGLMTQEVLEAGLLSATNGQAVTLPLPARRLYAPTLHSL